MALSISKESSMGAKRSVAHDTNTVSDKTLNAVSFADELKREMLALENEYVNCSSHAFHVVQVSFERLAVEIPGKRSQDMELLETAIKRKRSLGWFLAGRFPGCLLLFFNRDRVGDSHLSFVAETVGRLVKRRDVTIARVSYFTLSSRQFLTTYCCWKSWNDDVEFVKVHDGVVRRSKGLAIADPETERFLYS